jgi:hypothetical protein
MSAASETEVVAERARRVYVGQLRAKLEAEHVGEFVAIEPVSGAYFLGHTLSEAIQAARRTYPDRIAFAMRVGESTAVQIGMGNS